MTTTVTQNQASKKTTKQAAPPPESEYIEGFDPNVELETLDGADFEPIVGFVDVKGDGVTYPLTLEGIIDDVISYEDTRMKRTKNWYAIRATKDQAITFTDRETDRTAPVKKGMRVGLSESGAIRRLATKKGHFVRLTWTGETRDTGQPQPMRVVKVECSKAPMTGADSKVPF